MSDNTQDVTERLDHLEEKIDELTQTVENAMRLFSQSEKGEYIELTERRFQGNETNLPRIESRYRRTEYAIARVEI